MPKKGNLGPPKPFDPKVDDFVSWYATFETFLEANGLPVATPSPENSPLVDESEAMDTDELDFDSETLTFSPNEIAEVTSVSKRDISHEEVHSSPLPAAVDQDAFNRPVPSHEFNPVVKVDRPGFFGTGDTSSTFSLHKKRKLTATLRGMIGEAHVRFARGEQALAAELCMEVIKEMPTCPEPYHSLAMIYENEPEKSLQYLFIAAFLQPRGFKDWSRIGQMSLDFGNNRQALMCFRKAVIAEPTDGDLRLKLARIQEDMDDFKGALKTYSKYLMEFAQNGGGCVTALRRSACIFYKIDDIAKAHEFLSTALSKYPEFITPSETNLMLDLCIGMKKYVEACQILIKFENVQFDPVIPEEAFESRESMSSALQSGIYSCTVPENFAIDLLAKQITVLVHLEAYTISDKLGEFLMKHSVETYGDLYLDIAESYMAKRNYASAVRFLLPLIRSKSYSQAAVWLRYAECLFLLVRLEEAVTAYQEVVKLAPGHSLAKLNLAVILQKLGRSEDALKTLNQEPEEDYLDPELVMEKCHILYKRRQYYDFIELATLLLSRHCIEIQDKEDAMVIVMASNFGKRHASVLYDRGNRRVPEVEPEHRFIEKEVNLEREFKLYMRLCRLLFQMERYDLLAGVAYGCCASTVFSQVPAVENECEFHSFIASIFAGENDALPQHMRIILTRHHTNSLVLNLFGVALHTCYHSRYTRHVMRLLEKTPRDNRLILLNAHVSFTTGTYKNALMEYLTLMPRTPNDPLIPLMISSVLLHLVMQKTSLNRVQLCANTICFMDRYLELRGECQETYYNLARIYHSMGLIGLAIYYYQLVLQTEPPHDDVDPLKHSFFQDPNVLDLKCEAAYNLAQIYRRSGAHALARSYLFKYIQL